MEALNDVQLAEMKRAVGYRSPLLPRGSYLAYRNCCTAGGKERLWAELMCRGLARRSPEKETGKEHCYALTSAGLRALETQLHCSIRVLSMAG